MPTPQDFRPFSLANTIKGAHGRRSARFRQPPASPAASQATEDKPKRPVPSGVEPSTEAQRTQAPSEVGGKETTPAARAEQPTDERASPGSHDVTVDRTKNVVMLRKYPGIEYGPEVDLS